MFATIIFGWPDKKWFMAGQITSKDKFLAIVPSNSIREVSPLCPCKNISDSRGVTLMMTKRDTLIRKILLFFFFKSLESWFWTYTTTSAAPPTWKRLFFFFFLLFLKIFRNRPKFQRKFWNFPPSAAPPNWKRLFFFFALFQNFWKIFTFNGPKNSDSWFCGFWKKKTITLRTFFYRKSTNKKLLTFSEKFH